MTKAPPCDIIETFRRFTIRGRLREAVRRMKGQRKMKEDVLK